MRQRGAKIIIDTLVEQGAEVVFGYPGGAVIDIFDEIYIRNEQSRTNKNVKALELVLTSHEQGASHASDGYARASGKVGVCLATSGPGATNTVTGIATAYMDSVPMVVITGNVAMGLLGRDSFQEIDITGITMPITKHNYIVKDISELADIIREAFYIAKSGRPGPVLVDIPKDIQQAEYEHTYTTPLEYKPKPIDLDKVKEATELIAKSSRPLLYVGGGVIASNASAELIEFAEKCNIPVAVSMMGLGAFPASHPLYMGMIGMHGLAGVAFSVAESDLIIAVGARFSDRVATNRLKFASGAKVIHIDIDNAEIDKNVATATHILGDAKEALTALISCLEPKKHSEWNTRVKNNLSSHPINESPSAKLCPRKILKTIASLSDGNQRIATDVGLHQMFVAQTYPFENPRTLLSSGGLGTMGFGMGAAIGATFATGEQTILITGDGSFHMNMHELVTAVKYNLPLAVFVFNNNTLGMVRQWQKIFYHERYSSTTLNRATDYVKLAEAFGARGLRLTSNNCIEEVVKEVKLCKLPIVVDCVLDIDYGVFPMIPAGKTEEDIIFDYKKRQKK